MACSPLLSRLRLLLPILCAWFALAPGGAAQEFERLLSQPWRWRELAAPPGNRFHEVVALHHDGRLFSSYGAQVFVSDGARWEVFGQAPDDVTALYPCGNGLLVTDRKGVWSFLDDEGLHPTPLPTTQGWRSGSCNLSDGRVVVCAADGFYLLDGADAERLDLPLLDWIDGLGRTQDGRLLATGDGRAWIEDHGAWRDLELTYDPGSPARYGPIRAHGTDLWLFPDRQSFSLPPLRFDGTGFEALPAPVDSELAVSVPGHGFLSWHSDHGAQTYYDGAWHDIEHIPGTEGQIPDSAFSNGERLLVQMASGRLWSVDLASERWGLVQLPPPYAKAQVQALSPSRRGGLWAGSSRGLMRWEDGAIVEHHPEALGVQLNYLTATQEDSAGNVWVGSGSSFLGLLKLTDEGWERVESPADGFHVHSIRRSPNGELWFSMLSGAGNPLGPAGGLARFDGEQWTHFSVADGLPHDRCYDVLTRRNGDVLVATVEGIARLTGERWTLEPAYGDDAVRLLFESEDERLWLGAGIRVPGLRTFRGRQQVPLTDTALERLTIGAIVEDPARGLWFCGRKGLFLLDRQGIAHEITRELGIPARAYWPMLPSADSTFVLGSLEGGLVTFRPDDDAGPVVFDLVATVSEGGRSTATWHGHDPWSATPTEELRYRWRTPGLAWSAPFSDRTIDMGTLAPGEHTLEVEALDLMGNHSDTPARVEFSIPVPFWARTGVRLSAFLLALFVLAPTALAAVLSSKSRSLERRESERLALSEHHYRSLVERVRALFASFDSKGELTYISPGLGGLLGEDPGQLSTAQFLERVARENSPEAAALRATLLGRRRGNWTGELPLVSGEGSTAWLYATLTPIATSTEEEARWDFVAVDLTERREGERRERELEAKLTQARRLEAIGRLSAGIGHDFNNLLTAIAGNNAIVGQALAEAGFDALRPNLEEVDLATTQAQTLTRRLLSFGRAQSVEFKILEINATISAALPIIQRLLRPGVEFSFEPGPTLLIQCGDGQLERVLFNLVLNSQDAVRADGRLTVRTRRVTLDPDLAQAHAPLGPGDYAVLSVQDDGEGMDAATLERACEPFFTTKDEERGTGLGLATVHGIVSQCGGCLEISSTPGRGTTIDVYLPLAQEATQGRELPPSPQPGTEPEAANPTVLFCEDDAVVRSFIAQCLEEHGYRVLVAEGPAEALEIAATCEGPIDLLVTDVVMPVMNGFQLAQHLCAEHTDLPVLYVSGYSADLLNESNLPPGDFDLLKKPFRPAELLERVDRALCARPHAGT